MQEGAAFRLGLRMLLCLQRVFFWLELHIVFLLFIKSLVAEKNKITSPTNETD